jgi:microcystin-dependent protein
MIYQELFSAIGTSFGKPDNNSFNIPMLQGLFLRGVSGDKPENDPDVSLRATLKPGGNTGAPA